LHVPEQMGEVGWSGGLDQASNESGQLKNVGRGHSPIDASLSLRCARFPSVLPQRFEKDTTWQAVRAVSSDCEGNKPHHVVGWQQPSRQLHRQRQQPIERIESTEVEIEAREMLQHASRERQAVLIEQRDLQLPEIAVVLPPIEAITRDRRSELGHQRKRQYWGRQ